MISGILKKAPLLHLGCESCSGGKEEEALAASVLEKLGVRFEQRDLSCGCSALDWGDPAKFEAVREEAEKVLREHKSVIVGCGRCFHNLTTNYSIQAKHISQVILSNIPKNMEERGDVFYHDPCYLSRYQDLTLEPRKVLEALGYSVKEFPKNGVKTVCCGGYTVFPALRVKAAELRLSAIPLSTVSSACPNCTRNFKEYVNSKQRDLNKVNSKTYVVKSFLELVDAAVSGI
jgi:dimethylglycine catabolism B